MFDVIVTNGKTWLICGGRAFDDQAMFSSAMDDLIRMKGLPSRVVHGGEKGADTLAADWTKHYALVEHRVVADWETHGRAAGPIRNQIMISDYRPKLVVAFPGGRGTDDLIKRARKADIPVAEIKPTGIAHEPRRPAC